jgi:mono/diheme cytochrome c family protein
MKSRRVLSVTGIVLLAASFTGFAQDAAQIEKGKAVFASASPKCTMCHAIAGQGNAKHPLDGIGSKLSGDDIKAWIRTPKEMAAKAKSEAKPPMSPYTTEKISDADLDALVAYLLSLKAAK